MLNSSKVCKYLVDFFGHNYKERNEDTYQEQINVNLWKFFKENMIQDAIETTLKMSWVWTLSPLVNKYLCKKNWSIAKRQNH